EKLRIGRALFPRRGLRCPERAKWRLAVDLARDLEALDEGAPVDFVLEVIGLDAWRGERVGRLEGEAPARLGHALPYGGGEARVAMQRLPGLVHGERHHEELHVRLAVLRERAAACATHL